MNDLSTCINPMINSVERGFGLPKFSPAERERRWSRVRALMRREQLDAIIGFPNQSHWDQFQADIRYLTHIAGIRLKWPSCYR